MFRYIIFGYKDFPTIVSTPFLTLDAALEGANLWIGDTPKFGMVIEIVECLRSDIY